MMSQNYAEKLFQLTLFFIITVKHLVSLYGSSKNLWSGRWPQVAFLLWQAYGRWGRGWSFRRWMERIHSPCRWWKRQTRFPHEAGCPHQQWVLKFSRKIFCSFEGNRAVHSWLLDTYRYIKVNLFPVSGPKFLSRVIQSHWIHTTIIHSSFLPSLDLYYSSF